MKSSQFDQYEFELPINNCLSYRDEEKIAAKVGVSSGMISQYINANDERESPLYKAACILTAWIETSCRDGEKALGIFNSFVGRALPCPGTYDTNEERRKSYEERSEFYIAEAENKPLEKQIEELEESINQDTRLLAAKRAELQRLRQREAFPGQKVSHAVRAIGRRVVVKASQNGGESNHA